MAESDYDCQRCGACCVAGFDVLLDAGDEERFARDKRLLSLTVTESTCIGELRFMKKDASGRCAALRGPLHENACAVYRDRPTLCRQFEPGSDDCREARSRLGYDNP